MVADMVLGFRKQQAAPPDVIDEEAGGVAAGKGAAAEGVTVRGSYDVDEHHLSPQEVCARYGTTVDWHNIQGSTGLTAEQVWGD